MKAPNRSALPVAENRHAYPALNGLRAIAVLMVFVQHYLVCPETFRWGWTGVQFFFVLSGFLITGILYDTQNAPHRFRIFYARRALRIFPVFYFVILAGWALWPFFHWELRPAWLLWPTYLGNYARFIWIGVFTRNPMLTEHLVGELNGAPFVLYYGHFWSLGVEEQFYLLWPMIIFWVRKRERLIVLCVTAIVLTPVGRYVCLLTLPRAINQAAFAARATPFQSDALLLGALIALALRKPDSDPLRLTRAAGIFAFLFPALFVLYEIMFYQRHHTGLVFNWEDAFHVTAGLSCINLFGAALVVLCLNPQTALARLLNTRWLSWLGTISYGFYVFHDIPHNPYGMLATHVRHRLTVWFHGQTLQDPHQLLTATIALAGTLILANLSFYFLESPFLRLKRYFTVGKPEPEEDSPGHARAV